MRLRVNWDANHAPSELFLYLPHTPIGCHANRMRSYYTITAADAHANSLTKRAELTLTQSTFFSAEQLLKLKLPEQPKQLELFEQL